MTTATRVTPETSPHTIPVAIRCIVTSRRRLCVALEKGAGHLGLRWLRRVSGQELDELQARLVQRPIAKAKVIATDDSVPPRTHGAARQSLAPRVWCIRPECLEEFERDPEPEFPILDARVRAFFANVHASASSSVISRLIRSSITPPPGFGEFRMGARNTPDYNLQPPFLGL